MMRELTADKIRTQLFSWIFIIVLVVFLTAGVLLYWQNSVTLGALALWTLGLVIIGFLFVFGTRVAQKDGFIDGFRNGRDGVKRAKKKS